MFYFAERQEPRAPRKMETTLSEDQLHFLPKSLERPERWQRHFPKINCIFYFAKRQKPRAPRKMETLFSEDRWHVLLRRTARPQRATPRKIETRLSEAQYHFRFFKMTEALGETPTFDFRIGVSILVGRCFCEKPYANTPLSMGTKGRCYFLIFQNGRSPRRNAHFRLSNRVFDFWSECVFVRSPTRKHNIRCVTPLGPL